MPWVILLALALPSAVAAKKSPNFTIPASRSAEFHLKATNDYAVSVYASHGQVALTARRGSKAQVSYLVHGVTSEGRIKASFGDLGSIAVSFHPSGPPHQWSPEDGCRGEGEKVQRGTFVGKIIFEGEQAYTALSASRAQGREAESFKQICSEDEETKSLHPPLRWTLLIAGSESEQASFQAVKVVSKKHPAFNRCFFAVSTLERKQHVMIFRVVSADADVDSFTVTASSKTPALATVSPPAPFEGSATYEKAKGSPAVWTGSLSVSLPGLGVVPLTGSDWKAQLNPKASAGGSGSFTGSFFVG